MRAQHCDSMGGDLEIHSAGETSMGGGTLSGPCSCMQPLEAVKRESHCIWSMLFWSFSTHPLCTYDSDGGPLVWTVGMRCLWPLTAEHIARCASRLAQGQWQPSVTSYRRRVRPLENADGMEQGGKRVQAVRQGLACMPNLIPPRLTLVESKYPWLLISLGLSN